MQGNRIPRWLVESDPSWEKSIDSNLSMLKWTKKGTNTQAICPPTGVYCQVLGSQENNNDGGAASLANLQAGIERMNFQANSANDISKYLTSRYLNPGINGPARFDLRKPLRKF